MKGSYSESLHDLQHAIQLDSNYAYAYNNIGFSLTRLVRYEESKQKILFSLFINPDKAYAYKNMALLYLAMNRNPDACPYLHQALNVSFKEF